MRSPFAVLIFGLAVTMFSWSTIVQHVTAKDPVKKSRAARYVAPPHSTEPRCRSDLELGTAAARPSDPRPQLSAADGCHSGAALTAAR